MAYLGYNGRTCSRGCSKPIGWAMSLEFKKLRSQRKHYKNIVVENSGRETSDITGGDNSGGYKEFTGCQDQKNDGKTQRWMKGDDWRGHGSDKGRGTAGRRIYALNKKVLSTNAVRFLEFSKNNNLQ